MREIDKLKDELIRLDATEVEIIYSDESENEYELEFKGEQTNNLDIVTTLEAIAGLPDNTGVQIVWGLIVDEDT